METRYARTDGELEDRIDADLVPVAKRRAGLPPNDPGCVSTCSVDTENGLVAPEVSGAAAVSPGLVFPSFDVSRLFPDAHVPTEDMAIQFQMVQVIPFAREGGMNGALVQEGNDSTSDLFFRCERIVLSSNSNHGGGIHEH